MGGEALFTIAAALGAAAFLYLVYRCWQASTRPYALPTLVFSVGAGLWSGYGTPLHSYYIFFLVGFLLGAVIFGLHAAIIKTLIAKVK